LEAALASMTGKPAGLYMVAERLGYWSGTTFTSYIDNAGNFKFGGSSGVSRLEYSASANALRGVDASNVVQWYADGSDGKLYAGGGRLMLDSDGISLDTTQADGTFNLIRGYRMRNGAGQIVAGHNLKYTDNTDPEAYIYNNVDFAGYTDNGSINALRTSTGALVRIDAAAHTQSAGKTSQVAIRASHKHASGGSGNNAAMVRLYASASDAYVEATGMINIRSTA